MLPFRSAFATLERPRVNAALEDASRFRVTVISAPGGSGKSTAIDTYLRALQATSLTYVPHINARELLPYVRGLADELSGYAPTVGHGLSAASNTVARSVHPATALGKWFAAQLVGMRGTIVLDDLHVAVDCDEIPKFIAAAINWAPREVRWILGTRSTVPFPIAAWLAEDIAAICDDETLFSFKVDEVVALAAQLHVDREHAERLLESQGPHAGRIALALTTGTMGSLLPESWEIALVPPLATLLQGLEPRELGAVHTLVQLPSLEEEVVDCIPGAIQVLGELGRHAPYAFRSSETPRFTTAFCAAARLASPASKAGRAQAAHLAVEILEAKQQTAEALRIAALAGAAPDALRLLDSDGFQLLNQGYGDVVDAAVRTLSPEQRHDNSLALALEAMRESDRGRHDVADAWFSRASHIAPSAISTARIQYLYGYDLLRRGRSDCIEILKRITLDDTDDELYALVIATLASAYDKLGKYQQSKHCIQIALERIEDISDVRVRAAVHHRAAFVALRDYNVPAAERYASLALSLAEEHGHDDIAAPALSILSFVAIHLRDDVSRGYGLLKALEACSQRLGNAYWRRYALLVLIEFHSFAGDWRELRREEHALAREEIENDPQHADESLLPSRALRMACARDFAGAYQLLAGTPQRQSDLASKAVRWTELAVYASAAGLLAEAADAISRARARLRRVPASEAISVRARLNLTLALVLMGNTRSASALLAAAEENARAFPRLLRFHELLQAVLVQRQGADNDDDLLERFAALNESGFGGISKMIQELPGSRLLGLNLAS